VIFGVEKHRLKTPKNVKATTTAVESGERSKRATKDFTFTISFAKSLPN